MRKTRFKNRLALLAAVSALPIWSSHALAQRAIDNGHALDANNRVGSNGSNDVPNSPPAGPTGNQIVTGNVTGGFQFRGREVRGVNIGAGYTDPTAFRGILPGQAVDQFIGGSGGVPTFANPTPQPIYSGPQPYYGQVSTMGQLPANYVQTIPGGGYVPAQTVSPDSIDLRVVAPLDQQQKIITKPGEFLMPGPVDVSKAGTIFNVSPQSIYTASPLYGVQQVDLLNPLANTQAGQGNMFNTPGQENRIFMLQRELSQTYVPPAPTPPGSQSNQNGGAINQSAPNAAISQGTGSGAPIPAPNVTPQPGDASTGQTIRSNLPQMILPPPSQQSSQYAELKKRLEAYESSNPQSDEEANREFRAILQARRALDGAKSATPVKPTSPHPAGAPPQPPLQIGSIAEGVKASGLAQLLSQGEDLTRQKQYDKAISTFSQAMAVAPNNSLILIGRANAELGGGYFRQAETDLRDSFRTDPSVLMAQYDMEKMLGTDRLQTVTSDLKQIATDSPQNPTPVFLLAYIAYNTHHEDVANQRLDEALKRNPTDTVIPMIKRYWSLGGAATQPALNK